MLACLYVLDPNIMTVGVCGVQEVLISCQTRGRETGRGTQDSRPTLGVLLPLARSYHLNFPQDPRTATPAGGQASKRQSSGVTSCSSHNTHVGF